MKLLIQATDYLKTNTAANGHWYLIMDEILIIKTKL